MVAGPLLLPQVTACPMTAAVFGCPAFPSGFVAPCLPTKATEAPSGALWVHEIKHDGFRVIARKDGKCVRLYSRPGNDLTWRFPLIVQALASLRSRSCVIDGEAVACRRMAWRHLTGSATGACERRLGADPVCRRWSVWRSGLPTPR